MGEKSPIPHKRGSSFERNTNPEDRQVALEVFQEYLAEIIRGEKPMIASYVAERGPSDTKRFVDLALILTRVDEVVNWRTIHKVEKKSNEESDLGSDNNQDISLEVEQGTKAFQEYVASYARGEEPEIADYQELSYESQRVFMSLALEFISVVSSDNRAENT